MPPLAAKVKHVLLILIRAAVGVGLAVFLIVLTLRSTGADLWAALGGSNVPLVVFAFVFYGAIIAVTTVRWGLLLAVQGVHLGFWGLWRLTMIGVLFNLAIPGAVSGDFLKMAFIAKQAPSKRAEAIMTIMLDRVVGILGLFIVASAMVLVSLPLVIGLGKDHRPIQIAVLLVGLGSVGGIVAVLLVELRQILVKLPLVSGLLTICSRRLPLKVVSTVQRLVGALELYRKRRGTVAVAVAISVCVHTCLGLTLFSVGRGIGERDLRLREYMLATQVGNAVAAIPVTPGGLGTRDAIVSRFMGALGMAPAKAGAIPVTLSLIMVAWALVGAGVFVLSPGVRKPMEQAGMP